MNIRYQKAKLVIVKAKTLDELEALINEKLAQGFWPIGEVYSWEEVNFTRNLVDRLLCQHVIKRD